MDAKQIELAQELSVQLADLLNNFVKRGISGDSLMAICIGHSASMALLLEAPRLGHSLKMTLVGFAQSNPDLYELFGKLTEFHERQANKKDSKN